MDIPLMGLICSAFLVLLGGDLALSDIYRICCGNCLHCFVVQEICFLI